MDNTQKLLGLARNALKDGQNSRAVELADRILETRPETPQALYIRAKAHLQRDNQINALLDCLDGLALDNSAPQLVERFDALIVEKLLDDLDKNFVKASVFEQARTGIQKAPRVAAIAQLLALLGRHDVEGALAFGTALGRDQVSGPALRLLSHAHLSKGHLKAAIASLSESLELEQRLALSDPNMVAMLHYKWLYRASLRDPAIFPPRYRLAICAVLKDEADDLAEWLAYHANLGVEAFYLYDNDSTDATADIIKAHSQRFNITHYKVSLQPAQALTYRHFFEAHRFDTAWAAMIDGDEFINPVGGSLQDYLERSDDCAAIAMNWTVFGTSGLISKPDGLCIESFVKRGRDDCDVNAHIKGIVRPHRVIRYLGPHQQLVLGHYEDAMGNTVFPMQTKVKPPRHQGLRLHHYALKSREQAERKLARGRPVADNSSQKFRGSDYVGKFDCNDLEDRSAARFAPAVHGLMSGPVPE